MDRILQTFKRDYIAAKQAGDKLILLNERTGQTRELPKDASSWQRREAIKSLQEQAESKYDQPLSPSSVPERDKPLPVPISGGPLAKKRQAENAAFAAQEQAKRDRQQKLDDDRRIAEMTAEHLARLTPQHHQQEAGGLADVMPDWSEVLARAEARGQQQDE